MTEKLALSLPEVDDLKFVGETKNSYRLNSVGVHQWTFGQPEPITPVSVRRSAPEWSLLEKLPTAPLPWTRDEILAEPTRRGFVLRLPFNREEGIFGLGLHHGGVFHSGRKLHLRVNSDPIAPTGDSHAPVPFFLSTLGYGVLVDTARYLSFYFGTHALIDHLAERIRRKHGPPPSRIEEIYTAQSIGDETVIDIPAAKGVTLYVFSGPTLLDALRRYIGFSGGGCLPAFWGLGNWYRAFTGAKQDELLEMIDSFEREHLPINVMGLEPGWQSHFYPNSFTWGDKFPDPKSFVNHLRSRGMHVNLWENAFIHPDAPFADEIAPFCGPYPATDGLTPDFLNPTCREIFARHHREELVSQGIDGFKLDECDNHDFQGFAWSFPEHSEFSSGADGEQMHCLFGVHYQHCIDDVFRSVNRRHYGLVRSSGPLASSLPFALYSDLYEHLSFLRPIGGAGSSGLLWTPELRVAEDVSDLIRRLQATALSPLCLINGWYIPMPPWWQVNEELNKQRISMPEREEATRMVRKILGFRLRLLPYLYTAFAKYRFYGLPPFRPLAVDFASDRFTWCRSREILIGGDLLAVPLTAKENSFEVYLPFGTWRGFFDGKRFEGGRCYHFEDIGLEEILLFVREGAVLPLGEPLGTIRSGQPRVVFPVLYGEEPATIANWLYDDDGETYGFEREGNLAWWSGRFELGADAVLTHCGKWPAEKSLYSLRPKVISPADYFQKLPL